MRKKLKEIIVFLIYIKFAHCIVNDRHKFENTDYDISNGHHEFHFDPDFQVSDGFNNDHKELYSDIVDHEGSPSRIHSYHQVEKHHVIHHEGESSDIGDIFSSNNGDEGTNDFQADSWKTIKKGNPGAFKKNPDYYKSDYFKGRRGFSFSSGSGLCETRLIAPMNSALTCSTYSGCQATCLRGHQFPNGETQLLFYCHEGKWRVKGSSDDTIPQCHPSCLPPCQNSGICIAPNTCNCRGNFFGAYCQYEKKPCMDFPPLPNNARRTCTSESCTITCLDGHKFPDGSEIANVFCKDGQWTPGRSDWISIPDCRPMCDPPCRNGGNCLTNNICQCPQQFRGAQCQFSVDVCDARKLNFNGNYNCSGVGDTFRCVLSCPVGMIFQSTPAPYYTCDYSTGTFSPTDIPLCVFDSDMEPSKLIHKVKTIKDSNMNVNYKPHKIPPTYIKNDDDSDLINNIFVLEKKQPTSGNCLVWAGSHYKTFDGQIISFNSNCLYTLVNDKIDNMFHIQMSFKDPSCRKTDCSAVIHIYIGDSEYKLTLNENGEPVIDSRNRVHKVPTQLPGFRVDISNNDHSVLATLVPAAVTIRWNLKDEVEVSIGKELWNKTVGLCGTMDGYMNNDLSEYHDSIREYSAKWKVDKLEESCVDNVEEEFNCNSIDKEKAAHEFCNKILVDHRFDACRKVMSVRGFYDACKRDYCSCTKKDATVCACKSMAMFIHDCVTKGITNIVSWRDENTCPMSCTGGRVYMSCGPTSEPSCSSQEPISTSVSASTDISNSAELHCREGCFCPPGTFANGSNCLTQKNCPCLLRGKLFNPGDSVPNDCNTCTCIDGKWSCTDIKCLVRCEAIGDPHYTTFDGRHFNFMGKCSYYLIKDEDYSIEAENIACDGQISEALGFSSSSGSPSCTKTITIRLNNKNSDNTAISGDNKLVIKLKQGKSVFVNNEEFSVLHKTLTVSDVRIRQASSLFTQVELHNGITVWWDGETRVYVDAPPSMQGKTQGLCGTFTQNQKDDFLTPEGDIEQDPIAFANKWRTFESCDNVDKIVEEISHPCDINVQNKQLAEAHCSNITGQLFIDCHFFVDPAPYYESCLYDVCSCKGNIAACLCPIIAAYAKQCSHQGAIIDWRSKIRKCGLQCPAGQMYQICGDSCSRSCQDISTNSIKHCNKQCVEGCNCPEGRTLNSIGECIPVSQCHCLRDGMEYPPGHKDIQPGTKGLQFCVCKNAVWECRLATVNETKEYPNETTELKMACSAARHQVFTHCLPPEPLTCKNMHNHQQFSSAICHSGCICKRGYVLDSLTKECVRPDKCPCHHGGKSYTNGDQIQESCNTCACDSGKWNCTDHTCPAVCTTWGDSHFKTFDNKIYDFQGACDYILAKGFLSKTESFSVTVKLVPCGSSGITCPKHVTMHIGSTENAEDEYVNFITGKPFELSPVSKDKSRRIIVHEAGLFIFAEVPELGIVLQWDKGTRVMIRADPKWKGRLEGLCGNFNDNEVDDFTTPAGGVPEVSVELFGDSWKLYSFCPEATPTKDPCDLHPGRRNWAYEKCSVLKSPLFRPCHSEVPVDAYIQRCLFDTCGCDQGGDCECLCTAIAAYAQECNVHGVPIKWRSQQLCPIQCDEHCSEYSPCMETCPVQTCDNVLIYKSVLQMCQQDYCIEGCKPKLCPAGEVYINNTNLQCVPLSLCKPPLCLHENGTDFYEGDLMEEDECHRCYCSRNRKTCTGQPCSLSTTPTIDLQSKTPVTISTTPQKDEFVKCVSGWTTWLNRHQPEIGNHYYEEETLPTIIELSNLTYQTLGICSQDKMVDIKCRDASSKRHYKEFNQDVTCSLDKGLLCNRQVEESDEGFYSDICNDYEISVLCSCETLTTIVPTTVSLTTFSTTEQTLEKCDPSKLLTLHPLDCSMYYQCEDTEFGTRQIERSCPNNLWFNPNMMICDWPQTVTDIRPDCKVIVETVTTTVSQCIDSWSGWINISNPDTDGGDYELLSVMAREGIQVCKNGGHVNDIECQYKHVIRKEEPTKAKKGVKSVKRGKTYKEVVNWVDYKSSPDIDVTCNSDIGLECVNSKQKSISNGTKGVCQDYRIKVLCKCDNTRTTEKPSNQSTIKGCKSDEQFSDCKIHCDQVCLYYGHELKINNVCKFGQHCIPGCVPVNQNTIATCPPGFMWRDFNSCVRIDDCTCRSHKGQIVKPGEVVHESPCEICQCLNNHYVCDKSSCNVNITTPTESPIISTTHVESTTVETSSTSVSLTTNIIIIPTLSTPPPSCDENRFVPLLKNISDESFTASSSLPGHIPHFAKMINNIITYHGWKPLHNDKDQYLQIDLGNVEPVYGIVTKTNPLSDERITSFHILYSTDGVKYSYVSQANKQPQVFRGPVKQFDPLQEIFHEPFEARYIRISPSTWVNGIVLSLDIIGCGNETNIQSTTTEITTVFVTVPSTSLPVCVDKMGLDNGLLQNYQISVSSSLPSNEGEFKGADAALSSLTGWTPVTSSPHQWLQFDWLDQRTITGVITKGGRIQGKEEAWVEAYKVAYSHDGKEWSYLLDSDSKHKVFIGNFDADTPHTNYFNLPVHAQFVRIYPTKWNSAVIMRIEMLGCFLPYPIVTTVLPELTTPVNKNCNVCPGVTMVKNCPCHEESGKWWDGEQCSLRSQCPCIVGHISYAVGTVYDIEDCNKCTCSLGGIPECAKQTCPECPQDLQSVMTSSCNCICQPCPSSTKICKTSNVCINATQWCDGFIDCPDDEVNCTITSTTIAKTTLTTPTTIEVTTRPNIITSTATTTTTTEKIVSDEKCQPVECPDGYTVQIKIPTKQPTKHTNYHDNENNDKSWSPFGSKSKWGSYVKYNKRFQQGGSRKGRGGFKGHHHHEEPHKFLKPISNEKQIVCPEYQCIPVINQTRITEVCNIPKCSIGYNVVMSETADNECPKYKCVEIPEANCSVNGRTFNTFDGTEFKYDICNHTLAQDRVMNNWVVKLLKTCSYIGRCKKHVVIKNFNDSIELHTNMSVIYNGYFYSVPQMEIVGRQTKTFAIKQISNKFIVFISMMEFSVIWDFNGNVKLIVPGTSRGSINGLCGLYDGKPETDRQKPDGSIARTSVDFGDSWGNSDECETKVCPVHIQNAAWEMCSSVKKAPLSECEGVVNMDRFLSQCVESLCVCLESNSANSTELTSKCRCDALLNLVTECRTAKPNINLANWRLVNDCPVECPPPFVYKECYNRICEMSCTDLLEDDPCPQPTDSCFPGCYCPDGFVRNKDTCVKPAECRDCVCDSFGKTRYVTFDKVDFTYNSNCTYILTETVPEFDGPSFKVLATTGVCDKSSETCVKSVAIIHGTHYLQIGNYEETNELFIKENGEDMLLNYYPVKTSWFEADLDSNKRLIIKLLTAHLELIFHGRDKGLSIQLPSHLYYGKTQGLCGSCNNNQLDDFKTSDGKITEDIQVFGQSWLAKNLTQVKEENCLYVPVDVCEPPPSEKDICLKLLDTELFGKCHAVIDPEPFVEDCHEGLCKGQRSVCHDLESYARECQTSGICIPWRNSYRDICPYTCPHGLEYKACISGCPETCDNYQKLRKSPDSCPSPPGEGCVCAEGKVLLNGTCVLESRCQPCDSENHYAGDEWHPDRCTTCFCNAPNSIQCQRIKCPSTNTVCEVGHRSIVKNGTENDCCPTFICVPETVIDCGEPILPDCGFGQILKVENDKNGCQQFVCVCKPIEECDDVSLELNVIREPGIEAVLNNTGCCPRVEVICKKEKCPKPSECFRFFQLVETETANCCPDYKCEPPKDRCLYEYTHTNDENGGARKLTFEEKFTDIKKPGDTWNDGPCRTCKCQKTDLKVTCVSQLCQVVPTDNDYVIEEVNKVGECCPTFKKAACKVNDTVYKIGQVWKSPDGDVCKNITCKLNAETGDVYKQEIIENCNNECQIGWKIVPDETGLKCCGECKPTACVINGTVKLPDTVWFEDNDNCTTYSCQIVDGLPQIAKSQPWCPALADCPNENIVDDGCCQKCNSVTKPESHTCYPEAMSETKTLNLVTYLSMEHGFCENKDTIYNFMECRGVCDSFTFYNQHTGHHDSSCLCCQPTSYSTIIVPMICDDGFLIEKHVSVPSQCGCHSCGSDHDNILSNIDVKSSNKF